MKKRLVRRKNNVLFNLEIFREGQGKEIKISAMPLKYLDEVIENIRIKYK